MLSNPNNDGNQRSQIDMLFLFIKENDDYILNLYFVEKYNKRM